MENEGLGNRRCPYSIIVRFARNTPDDLPLTLARTDYARQWVSALG